MKPLLSFLFSVITLFAFGQSHLDYDVQGTFAKKLGKTRPVREFLNAERTSLYELSAHKSRKPRTERNFENAVPFFESKESALPAGPDPLYKSQKRLDDRIADPLVVAEGISEIESGSGVPDPNGDVSDNYFVEVVNASQILVMDKEGHRLAEPFAANSIWEQLGQQSAGDPIILYDQMAGRWFLAEFPFSNTILIAISEDEDPLGAWTAYSFNTPSFPDYPKFSIWPGSYLMTVNEFGDDGIVFYSINREKLLAGEEIVEIQRHLISRLTQPGVQTASPVGMVGDIMPGDDVKPMIVRINDDGWENVEQDQIELFEIDTDWEEPDSTKIREIILPTSPFNAEFCENVENIYVCVPQPNDNGLGHISGIPRLIWHRVSYRNFEGHGAIVLNFGVDVTGETDAGIRWMELRKPQGEEWSIYQEGTYGTQDGVNRYLGGINIDAAGNIGLGYAMSSEIMYPSLAYTGRLAGDPLGEMTYREEVIVQGESASSTPRFGDYHSMAVDRNNTFWFTGQYMAGQEAWSTKVAAFRLQREQNDVGVLRLAGPADSTDLQTEEITVEIKNFGFLLQDTFHVGLEIDGQVHVIDTINDQELEPDSLRLHTFSLPYTFDSVKTYDMRAFIAITDDQFVANDTLNFSLRKLGRLDASVLTTENLKVRECNQDLQPKVVLQNAGLDTLKSVSIAYAVNAVPIDTIEWEGALVSLETQSVELDLTSLEAGKNVISVILINPNGGADQNITNDTLSKEFEVFLSGDNVNLLLFLDNEPVQTSWEVIDSIDNVLFSGGPYDFGTRVVEDDWCLDPEQCFRFVLNDSGGDGMVSPGSEGRYEIKNSTGQIIATLGSPFFDFTDTTDFCPDFDCLLHVNPFTRHASSPGSANGQINMFASGGVFPYQFSIDSGATFKASSLFNGLAEGVYHCLVRDAANCDVYFDITIYGCTLEAEATATDATNDNSFDGTITITTTAGVGDKRYSISGGAGYQDDPFFDGLGPGTYDVEVLDSLQCGASTNVTVGQLTSSKDLNSDLDINVYPNPSNGLYFLEVKGLDQILFAPYSIYDMTGRRVAQYEAGNFDGVLRAAFSITDQPSGVYTLRFEHPDFRQSLRLVKTD